MTLGQYPCFDAAVDHARAWRAGLHAACKLFVINPTVGVGKWPLTHYRSSSGYRPFINNTAAVVSNAEQI